MFSAITEPTAEPEEMLTVAEVAAVLKVSFPNARRLVMGDSPAITSVKIGRLRRVRRSDLNAYMRGLAAA